MSSLLDEVSKCHESPIGVFVGQELAKIKAKYCDPGDEEAANSKYTFG